MRTRVLLAAWLVGACCAAAGVAAAVEPGSRAPADPGVSPAARAVLARMTAYLQSLERFSIAAVESHDEALPYGYKVQYQQQATLLVQRPDRLRVDVDGDLKTRSYYYDGRTLTILASRAQVYAQVPAPETIAATVDALLARGVEMPLIDVLAQAFHGTLASQVRAGALVGESRVGGVAVDHLAFRQADVDWQLWVEKGARPVPRKIVITTRHEVGEPQFEAVLDWDVDPEIAADAFRFTPPAGTRRIELTGGALR